MSLHSRQEDFAAALSAGEKALSHVWYPLSDLKGFLPFKTDSPLAWKLFVRWPDGHELAWLPSSRTRGATEWSVRRDGEFEI